LKDTRLQVSLEQDKERVGLSFNLHRNIQEAAKAVERLAAWGQDLAIVKETAQEMFGVTIP